MCWRRHVGMDREGDDVGLVDHQPHPAVGRDLVADPGHEVLGEPVRLELVAVGLGRPRRVEAGPLDGVDGRQVVDPHRLDAQPHRGSRDHDTSPPSDATPRGKRHVLGHEPGEVVDVAGGQARRAEARRARRRARRGPPRRVRARRPAPGRRGRGRRATSPARRSGSSPARTSRAGTPATDERTGPTGPAGSSRTASARRPRRGEQRLGGRDPDDRHAQPVGQALGRRDPDPQAGERARTGADDDRRRRERRESVLAEEPPRWPAGASRRGGSRPASRSPRSARPTACRPRRRPGSWRCRWPGSTARAAVGCRRRSSARPSR